MPNTNHPAPTLAAAVMLADELAFHLTIEFLAESVPGFSDYFCREADRLLLTGQLPAQTQVALQDTRDHIAFVSARPGTEPN